MYTPNGKIASIQDVTGKSTHYSYDNANHTQQITDETGKSLAAYSYGVNGQVEKIVYGNGITSTDSYDGDENVKSLVTSNYKLLCKTSLNVF